MVHRLSRRERFARPPTVAEDTEPAVRHPPTYASEDEKIAGWCREMLARGESSDWSDIRYVRGCAQREADTIRSTRPDLAAKLDAVAAKLDAKLPEGEKDWPKTP